METNCVKEVKNTHYLVSMATVFIYALNDPVTGRTRYIGKAKDPYFRYEEHLDNNPWEKTHKANWIRLLLNSGKTPTLEVLDEVLEQEWQFWEKEYIRLYRLLGFSLVNGTDGGDGVTGLRSLSSRIKMSISKTGNKNPNFGKPRPLEVIEKIRLSNLGKKRSEETCKKCSAWQLGKKISSETREKMRQAQGRRNIIYGRSDRG